jgi:hypothetical protein
MGKAMRLIELLSEELKTKIPEIDFAFLFGSYAKGTQRPDSDLDIAIYLNTDVSLDLISRSTSIIETTTGKRCDLCILNKASEILRFEVLKGKLMFVRERKIEEYVHFYSLTCREYEDQMTWMNKQLRLREQHEWK